MCGSREHRDCKLNAEDVASVISHTLRNTPRSARGDPARGEISREVEVHQESAAEVLTERRSKTGTERRLPDMDAADLKRYIARQIHAVAAAELEKAKEEDGPFADSPPPLRRSATTMERRSKACSIF